MKKKTKIIIISILSVMIVALSSYKLIGSINVKNKTYEYLSSSGCTKTYVKNIQIKHSFMMSMLSYDEWSILVNFTEKPSVLYQFSYKNNGIIFRGISDSQKDKAELRALEDMFVNGELCNSDEKEQLFGNSHWQAVDNDGNKIEGNYIKFSNKGKFLLQSRYTFDLYENYELVAGFGTYDILFNSEVILTSNRSTDFIWKYNIVSCPIINEELHCSNGFVYKQTEKEVTDRLDTVTLKLKESTKIQLGNKKYTLKLLRIDKNPEACIGTSEWSSCTKQADFGIEFSINGVVFALDSNMNASAQIITVNFGTDYVIYYVPEYKDNEATFFIEKDPMYQKETNLIIGNYLVYVDDNKKVIDITTFTKELQTWGKKYAGKDLKDIREMINKGEDLKNN